MSTALPRTALAPVGGTNQGPRPGPLLGGIVFDVPDVFYDATVWRRWLFQMLGRMGVSPSYLDFHRAWENQLVDVHRGRREYADALQCFLLSQGLSWAQVDEIEASCRIKRQQLEIDVRPLLGVARVVEELNRRKLPLVAWADVPHSAAKLAERLDRLVPRARFAAVLTSLELECAQPAVECYRAAVEQLGCEPEHVLYVGHDAEHLAGAASFGLKTAAVNYEATARADFPLARLEELVPLVDRLRTQSGTLMVQPPAAATLPLAVELHGANRT
jgi:FMN phosphatase YigB (HAD superfamily)